MRRKTKDKSRAGLLARVRRVSRSAAWETSGRLLTSLPSVSLLATWGQRAPVLRVDESLAGLREACNARGLREGMGREGCGHSAMREEARPREAQPVEWGEPNGTQIGAYH